MLSEAERKAAGSLFGSKMPPPKPLASPQAAPELPEDKGTCQ